MSVKERLFAVLDSTDLSEPSEIAEKLLAECEDPLDALREVLPVYVRVALTWHRRPETPTNSPAAPVVQPSGSPRWRQASSVFQARWRGLGGYKPLAKFDEADVRYVIVDRATRAEGNLRVKAQFERLLALLAERNVALVGELPEAEVEEVLR